MALIAQEKNATRYRRWIISAYRPRLSGHRHDTLTCSATSQRNSVHATQKKKERKKRELRHVRLKRDKKYRNTLLSQRREKTKKISHCLVSVKNRNPPVTFIQNFDYIQYVHVFVNYL